jgi:hypothetical protein
MAEARAQVVSPDTVDPDIKQDTESVPEAAKVANDISGDIAEAKAAIVSVDTVDPDIKQDTKSVAEAAKVAADGRMGDETMDFIDPAVGEQMAEGSECPRCHGLDAETFDTEEGRKLYCHDCDKITWDFAPVPRTAGAAAGDCMPEEVKIDFGEGDLADIVMVEEGEDDGDK